MDEPILPAAGAIVAVCAHIAPSTPLDEVAHLVARPAVCVDLDGLRYRAGSHACPHVVVWRHSEKPAPGSAGIGTRGIWDGATEGEALARALLAAWQRLDKETAHG